MTETGQLLVFSNHLSDRSDPTDRSDKIRSRLGKAVGYDDDSEHDYEYDYDHEHEHDAFPDLTSGPVKIKFQSIRTHATLEDA